MELEVWFTSKKGYRFTKIDLPANVDKDFYEKLKLRLLQETEKIKAKIKIVADKYNTSFSKPRITDPTEKIRTKKLIKARKYNLIAIERLDNLLRNDDYIICERCKNLMHRCPINIPYEKVGSGYLLLDNSIISVEYIYKCSSPTCNSAIDEKTHTHIQNTLRLRRLLLEKGESFVPNKFGFWHWENNKKSTKPFESDEDKEECEHCWTRNFEYINIEGQKNPFVKIQEECVRCNKVVDIR